MEITNNIDNDIYLPISFYLRTKIIDMSKDTIKRKIRLLKNNSDNIIKILKINKIEYWTINYKQLDYFKRRRAHKKNTTQYQQLETKVISSDDDRGYNYEYELTINLLDGCNISNAKGGSYDLEYYNHIATKIYALNRRNMFYVVEKDKNDIYHLHVGINGDENELLVIIDHVLQQLVQKNDSNVTTLTKGIHFSKIIDTFSFKKYLQKNDSKIGKHDRVSYIYKDEN